jgi:hypothetical protein
MIIIYNHNHSHNIIIIIIIINNNIIIIIIIQIKLLDYLSHIIQIKLPKRDPDEMYLNA